MSCPVTPAPFAGVQAPPPPLVANRPRPPDSVGVRLRHGVSSGPARLRPFPFTFTGHGLQGCPFRSQMVVGREGDRRFCLIVFRHTAAVRVASLTAFMAGPTQVLAFSAFLPFSFPCRPSP